jgi:hypothetical protein
MRWIAAWILAAAVYLARAEQARPQGPATESRTATRATEPSACGQECLLERMAKFLDAARTGRLETLPLAEDAEVRENARLIRLEESAWKKVRAVRSSMVFADPVTGNVVSRAGVELEDGRPGYISTRLRVGRSGRITDVEISADLSSRVVAAYVWNLDPLFTRKLAREEQIPREELEALARRYFHSLSTHVAVHEDFAPECNRYHSGQQITNVERNAVEGGGRRTCASSLEGNVPWGPATEQRFPIVDPERGIVMGITLLHYPRLPDRPKMYVSELFKVVKGRIVKIDNIGLMVQGVDTLGFVH